MLERLSSFADSYGKRLVEYGDRGPANLVAFTLLCSSQLTHSLLYLQPKAARNAGSMLALNKAYFECLWQLQLLVGADDQVQETVAAKLYPYYETIFVVTVEDLNQADDHLAPLLRSTTGSDYRPILIDAVKTYIHGEGRAEADDFAGVWKNNILALTQRLIAPMSQGATPDILPSVIQIVGDATMEAHESDLLARFSLNETEFPDSQEGSTGPIP
jgi:hypothetical protein